MKQFIDNFAAARELPFPQVAQHYGLVIKNRMCSCPFHQDKHPSMRVYQDHAYCFSCNTYVDNISLVQKLYDYTPVEALNRIKTDFGLNQTTQTQIAIEQRNLYLAQKRQAENKDLVLRELIKFFRLLQTWKSQWSPKQTNGISNKYFVYAINNEAYTGYVLDILLAPHTEKEEEQLISQIITSKWFETIQKINKKF